MVSGVKTREASYPRRIGSAGTNVAIYRTRLKGIDRYQLRWTEAGEVKRQTIKDERRAVATAKLIVDRLAAGDHAELTLTVAEAATYRRAVEACAGVPLDIACLEWSNARRALGPVPLATMVADHVRRTQGETITVAALVARFLEDRRGRGVSTVYLERLEHRLAKLTATFGPRSVRDVTEGEIRKFVTDQGGAARTRKNMRDAIVTVWRFARRERFLPRDLRTEAEMVEAPAANRRPPIEIFTPDEMSRILTAARDNIRPALAICAFSGVRSQGELSRLRWGHIKIGQGIIEVEAKTGERRLAPVLPNLAAWLAPFAEIPPEAFVCSLAVPDGAFARAAVKAGLQWRHNALRHSFGSYRVAQTKSVDQTSLEMGNSPVMIKRHYLEAVHEDEAAKWFGIMPPKSEV